MIAAILALLCLAVVLGSVAGLMAALLPAAHANLPPSLLPVFHRRVMPVLYLFAAAVLLVAIVLISLSDGRDVRITAVLAVSAIGFLLARRELVVRLTLNREAEGKAFGRIRQAVAIFHTAQLATLTAVFLHQVDLLPCW